MSSTKGIDYSKFASLSPEEQRKVIAEARKQGVFDAQKHLDASPIGKAIAQGMPLPNLEAREKE